MSENPPQLRSQEGCLFAIPSSLLRESSYLQSFLSSSAATIDLPSVQAEELEKIFEFCSHYEAISPAPIEQPLKSADLKDAVPAWDAAFIELAPASLLALIQAASVLDVRPLLQLGCAKLASIIKSQTSEDLKQTFNLS
jgi:S-phase kinase-associated protein 1